MRSSIRLRRTVTAVAAIGLLAVSCSSDDTSDEPTSGESPEASETDGEVTPVDGPAITVGSFNFPESVILAEIYAQALEANGYTVERNLNLGARELIFPELENDGIDLLPEYVGSALGVGFGGAPTGDLDETLAALTAEFEAIGASLGAPAPGEDKNVFVVTQAFADDNGVADIADLAGVDEVRFAGPPECEGRETCLGGLQDVYGLSNLAFQSVQEASTRIADLENGNIDMTLLFSTQPVIAQKGFVALEDSLGMIPVENIVPVLSAEATEAYGADLIALLDSISASITTEALIDLNTRVEIDVEDPADVAAAFLAENA